MKILTAFFLLICLHLQAQSGFQILSGKKTTLRFQLVSNLILLPVNINGTDLTFILDSGVKETILFSLENKDINLKNAEKVTFRGLGGNFEIEGIKSENNIMQIGKNLKDPNHRLYIILDAAINFSERLGVPVNGVIGYDFFRNNIVKIDYQSQKITVYPEDAKLTRKLRKYEKMPISLELQKPYLEAEIELTAEKQTAKLLIDLGNSDALWLFPDLMESYIKEHPHIEDYLGRGFNGDVFGSRTRIRAFSLGNSTFETPVVAMPYPSSIKHLNMVAGRKGSIGGEIWHRYTVVLDYPHQQLYLRKNKSFNTPFYFNKTGMEIMHKGMKWVKDYIKIRPDSPKLPVKDPDSEPFSINTDPGNFQYRFTLLPQYEVASCRKDSPCDKAGIKAGDKLLNINGKKAEKLSLQKINQILRQGEDGEIIKIEIERDSQTHRLELTEEDPIPFRP